MTVGVRFTLISKVRAVLAKRTGLTYRASPWYLASLMYAGVIGTRLIPMKLGQWITWSSLVGVDIAVGTLVDTKVGGRVTEELRMKLKLQRS